MTFGVWLRRQSDTEPDVKLLQAFAAAQGAGWPYHSDGLADYLEAAGSVPTDSDRSHLLQAIGRTSQRWGGEAKAPPQGFWGNVGALLRENLSVLVLAVFGLLIGIMLAWGMSDGDFLSSIAKPEQARGLITFLFAFSTIAMLLLVAVATFWMDKDEIGDRFNNAKDLITIVIGVLGTILGFYFGSADRDEEGRGLFIANVASSSPSVAPGGTVDLTGVVMGGAAPYRYSIAFSDGTDGAEARTLDIAEKSTGGGAFSERIVIPGTINPLPLNFTIAVKDANGTLARSTGTLFVTAEAPPVANSVAPAVDR